MSGKKVNYGRYAHVKLSFEKIDGLVHYFGEKYDHASKEQAAFVFYYLSCARNLSGAMVKLGNFVTHLGGWVTCRVFESKFSGSNIGSASLMSPAPADIFDLAKPLAN